MLPGILHRLEAAEVHRGLGLARVPLDPLGDHLGREHRAVRRGAQRLGQPAVAQQRRVDAVRELAQLAERRLDVAAQLLEHRLDGLRIGLHELAGQADLDRERDEVLLRAVVEVALDPAPGLVGGSDDAQPGGLELRVALLQGLEAGLERRVEPDVVQREADLARELGQHALGLVGEGDRVGRPLGHDQPEQDPGVHDRSDAHDTLPRSSTRPGHPHLEPGVARDARPGDHRELLGGEHEPAWGRGPGTETTRSSTPSVPVQTSAVASCMLSLSDSASWSSSSSIGTALDMRLPKVWIASSGDRRSP